MSFLSLLLFRLVKKVKSNERGIKARLWIERGSPPEGTGHFVENGLLCIEKQKIVESKTCFHIKKNEKGEKVMAFHKSSPLEFINKIYLSNLNDKYCYIKILNVTYTY